MTRRAAWTRYWQTGALHSCPTSFDDNYSGAIADFWADSCNMMPAQPHLLDIATGNGAIPKLLTSALLSFEIDAVDLADIAPDWHTVETYPHARFHTGISAEHLPFPDSSFDGVCSQFGIEYAEQPSAWHEALRVLKPDGRIFCVLHHADSVFTRVAREEAAHLRWLVHDEGLIAIAKKLAPFLLTARQGAAFTDPQTANRTRAAFNITQEALERRLAEGTHTDVLHEARANVQAILQRAPNPLSELTLYQEALEQAQLRCFELTTAALDRSGAEEILKLLYQHQPDHRIEILELTQTQGLIAWGIRSIPG